MSQTKENIRALKYSENVRQAIAPHGNEYEFGKRQRLVPKIKNINELCSTV